MKRTSVTKSAAKSSVKRKPAGDVLPLGVLPDRELKEIVKAKAITAEGGCQSCHTHQSCADHCPSQLNPTESIAGLKRRAMEAYLKGEL